MEELREEQEKEGNSTGTAPDEEAETADESVEPAVTEPAEEETGEDEAAVDSDESVEPAATEPAEEETTADEEVPEGETAEAAPEEPEKETEDDRFEWFVIHTYSGHEERAASNIERAVTQADLNDSVPRILVPTESVAEMKNGKKTVTDKKFFPSYVLVQMEMSDEAWRVVSNTPGVTRFVGIGAKPQPISKDEIDRILGRVEGTKEKPTPTIPYNVGEHVKVADGPFTDFTGVVDEVYPEKGKLKVMVSIFGRATPVELDFLQVKNL